jgi:periplasmic divalent cation tolerance protein
MQPADPIVLALTTCPDADTARRIAEILVGERLAACVNRIADVRSTYFWDGRLQDDGEILLLIKTTAARLPALEARLKALHPYELPELIALPVLGGNEAYLNWVRQGVQQESKQ